MNLNFAQISRLTMKVTMKKILEHEKTLVSLPNSRLMCEDASVQRLAYHNISNMVKLLIK